MSLRGGDMPAGQHHAHRDLERNMARQPMDPARAGHQADPRFRQPETRMVGRDNDVASERDFESAAQREAVNRGDDRLDDIVAVGDPGEAAAATSASARRDGRRCI